MIEQILKGEVRSAARLLSMIEAGDPAALPILTALYPHTGKAHLIGVTGVSGVGKSTLISQMTARFRRQGKQVGILAVDPSSPFSGGAVLGDRVRMRDHFCDEGVFIRSLATRGNLGGVSHSIHQALHVLEAMGKEIICVETIGVGQDQVDISAIVQTVIIVLVPEMGDEIQGLKAGLLEIGDIYVVNKADLPGADTMIQQVRKLLTEGGPVLCALSALTGDGIDPLVEEIEKRHPGAHASGVHREKRLSITGSEVKALLKETLFRKALSTIPQDRVERVVRQVAEREIDPYTAVERLIREMFGPEETGQQ